MHVRPSHFARTPLRRPGTRPGSAYVLVLGASVLLVTAGIGALYAAGVRRSTAELGVEAWRSRLAAEAGIDAALETLAGDANWRTTYAGGAILSNRSTATATFSVTAVDPVDGNISNTEGDPVTLTSVAVSNRGRAKLKVTLNSRVTPLSCLQVAACSGGLQTHTGTALSNDQTLASNVSVAAVLASISGRVEATTVVTGVTFTGTVVALQPARELPAAGVFTTWISRAVSVTWASIPSVAGRKTLHNALISPDSGVAGGGKSAAGIYFIDCAGNNLDIYDCRIVGTLILRNPGAGSSIKGSLNWSPTTAGYPVLLVDGSIALDFSSSTSLSEVSAGTNFNPAGTPYQGVGDADSTDSYPSEIRGLVYASGNISTSNSPKIVGNLVCAGTLSTTGSLTLSYDNASASAPPPGFFQTPVPMVIVPGSWEQLVD
ncbi:MAG: hypothetical protein AB7K52_09605 [Phycisphaerales bacterium]